MDPVPSGKRRLAWEPVNLSNHVPWEERRSGGGHYRQEDMAWTLCGCNKHYFINCYLRVNEEGGMARFYLKEILNWKITVQGRMLALESEGQGCDQDLRLVNALSLRIALKARVISFLDHLELAWHQSSVCVRNCTARNRHTAAGCPSCLHRAREGKIF